MEAGNDHQRFNKIWNVTIYDFVCSETTTYALVHKWQYKRVLICADRGQKATEEMAFLLVHGPSSVVLLGTSKPSTTVTDRPGSFKMGWHVILITKQGCFVLEPEHFIRIKINKKIGIKALDLIFILQLYYWFSYWSGAAEEFKYNFVLNNCFCVKKKVFRHLRYNNT